MTEVLFTSRARQQAGSVAWRRQRYILRPEAMHRQINRMGMIYTHQRDAGASQQILR